MKGKVAKKKALPEDSIKLRVAVCAMICIALCAGCLFGESQTSVVEIGFTQIGFLTMCIWVCIGGCVASHHHRNGTSSPLSVLKYLALMLLLGNFARELFIENYQSVQFQFYKPIMHVLIGTALINSFELKSRGDINATAAFGLFILMFSAASGRSLLYGIFVFLYACVAAVFLYFECESRTFRPDDKSSERQPQLSSDASPARLGVRQWVTMGIMPVLAAVLFLVAPRADAFADNLSIWMRSELNHSLQGLLNLAARPHRPDDSRLRHQIAQEIAKSRSKQQRKVPPNSTKMEGVKLTLPNKAGGQEPVQDKAKDGDYAKGRAATMPPQKGERGVPDPNPKPEQEHSPKPSNMKGAPPKPSDKKKSSASSKGTGNKKSEEKPPKEKPPKDTPPQEKPTSSKKEPAKDSQAEKDKSPGGLRHDQIRLTDKAATEDTLLFKVATNRRAYLHETTYDTFDGTLWRRSDITTCKSYTAPYGGLYNVINCPAFSYSTAAPFIELRQDFLIESDKMGKELVFAGAPEKIWYDGSHVSIDNYGTVSGDNPFASGDKYSVQARYPLYALSRLRSENFENDSKNERQQMSNYLQIPQSQSSELAELGFQTAGTQNNRFVECESIANMIRTTYKYTTDKSELSSGENGVDKFLFETKSGDCKQFASAFVILCRSVGIPSRMVSGYYPGDPNSLTGLIEVKSKHYHTWAEAYMPPYGWVPFDCTPGGTLPGRPEEKYMDFKSIVGNIENAVRSAAKQGGSVAAMPPAIQTIDLIIRIACGIVAFVAGLYGMRLLWQSWIAYRKRAPKHPASILFNKVVRNLERVGVVRKPSETGLELSRKLSVIATSKSTISPELNSSVEQFMHTYNECLYGNQSKIAELKRLSNEIKTLVRTRSN